MDTRPLGSADLPTLLDLTIETFRPFYEGSFRTLAGEAVFTNRHGDWKEDYRRLLAGIHSPDEGKLAAVALVDGQIAGFVGWVVQEVERHGEIVILAVAASHRRLGAGRALALHAMAHIKATGAEVISIGTGGDDFHAPARTLYESLGFTPFPNVSYTMPV